MTEDQKPPQPPEPGKPNFLLREQREPGEAHHRIPRWFVVFALAMTVWGTQYFFHDIGYPPDAGDRRTPIVIDKTKAVDGGAVFAGTCAACHQATGQGLPGAFPPLAGSEWVNGPKDMMVQIVLHGLQGAVQVKGQTYQGAMPSFEKTLDDASLAAVISHVRSAWGNSGDRVTVEDIVAARKRFPDRSTAWSGGDELHKTLGE